MDVYVESQRQDDLCLGSQLPHAGERDPCRAPAGRTTTAPASPCHGAPNAPHSKSYNRPTGPSLSDWSDRKQKK